jgi:glycine cleavage system aminomethyltransferase T
MVPTDLAAIETKLDVATPEGDAPARVVPKPFIDPNKNVPKS